MLSMTNYDSMAERSAADDVVLPFKNLVNDTYAKDISIKVRSSKAVKAQKWRFCRSLCCLWLL